MPKPNGKPMLENAEKKPQDRALLAKALNEEKMERAKKCGKEIQEVLKRHDCVLTAQPVTVPGPNGLFMLSAQPMVLPRDGGA